MRMQDQKEPPLRLVYPPTSGWVIHCTRAFCPFMAEAPTQAAAVQALADHLCDVHFPEHLKKGA